MDVSHYLSRKSVCLSTGWGGGRKTRRRRRRWRGLLSPAFTVRTHSKAEKRRPTQGHTWFQDAPAPCLQGLQQTLARLGSALASQCQRSSWSKPPSSVFVDKGTCHSTLKDPGHLLLPQATGQCCPPRHLQWPPAPLTGPQGPNGVPPSVERGCVMGAWAGPRVHAAACHGRLCCRLWRR